MFSIKKICKHVAVVARKFIVDKYSQEIVFVQGIPHKNKNGVELGYSIIIPMKIVNVGGTDASVVVIHKT